MIKIDLDTTKGKSKYVIKGTVEVKGEIATVAKELYVIIKNFEEIAPESWFMAMDERISEV